MPNRLNGWIFGDGFAVRDVRIFRDFLVASEPGKIKGRGRRLSVLHELCCLRKPSDVGILSSLYWSAGFRRLWDISLFEGVCIFQFVQVLVGAWIFKCVQRR